MPGRIGATRTEHGTPASFNAATASRRARGCGVPGSVRRQASSSTVPIENAVDTSATSRARYQELDVPQDQRALGEDRERVPALREDLDDPRHQAVAALRALVGVGGGPHGDVLSLPARRRQLAPQDVGRVHLHDDLRLEVAAGVHVEIGVGRPGEAVDARVRAAAVGVDRPVERHRAARNAVDDPLRLDLDELDPAELRRVDVTSRDLEELFGHAPTLEHMFDSGKVRAHGRGRSGSDGPGNGNDRGPTCPGRVEVIDREPAAHGGNVTFENPASVP